MKHAVWTAVLMLTGLAAVEAQQSGKAVVGSGSAPSTQYVWVTINGTAGFNLNSVAIRQINGNAVTVLTGGTYGFNQPNDIVGSTAHHRVFVSNQGAGTVSVVDSDTLQSLGPVTLPGCSTARGMSLSEDESAVFVAGADANGPAVWRIDTTTLSPGAAAIGGVTDGTHIAEDCVVIRAANVGGSGNGPGKVYFSVRASGTLVALPGYIGVIHLNPAAAFTSIQTQAGPLTSVGTPINMERTQDSRFVFVACTKVTGTDPPIPPPPPYSVRILRIDVSNDSATAPQFANAVQDLPHQVLDVAWRTDSGGNNRGFVLVSIDNGTPQVFEIFDTGLPQPVAPFLATGGGLTTPLTIRFAPSSEQVFIGDDIGTGNGYAAYNAKVVPLSFMNSPVGVGSRCLNFAVMPTPAAVVTDICPRGGLAAPSLFVTVHGGGFTAGSQALIGGLPVTTNVLDSSTLLVDVGGAGPSLIGLQVNNPNFQSASIAGFFHRYTPEVRNNFTIALPSAGQGYRMLSIPQYSTLTSFKAALAAVLGPYNPVLYRVFLYRGGAYVELNGVADDGCDLAGESFWIITRNGATLTMNEPDVRNNDNGANRVIPINPGFNMISLPEVGLTTTAGSIPWPQVLATIDPTNFATATPVTSGTVVTPVALEYVGGGYVTADPLLAGRGYWVENTTAGPAYLVFPHGSVTKPGGSPQAGGAPPPSGMTPPPPPSGMSSGASGGSSGGGCGLLGLEGVLALAFLRLRRRRRLAA